MNHSELCVWVLEAQTSEGAWSKMAIFTEPEPAQTDLDMMLARDPVVPWRVRRYVPEVQS